VVDAATGKLHFKLGPFKVRLRKVSFSTDGKWLASGPGVGLEEPAIIINVDTGEIESRFSGSGDSLPTFHPDGQRVVTANLDGSITLWRWNDAQLDIINSWKALDGLAQDLVFNDNGSRLVSSDNSNAIRVWDPETGEQLAAFNSRHSVFWLAHHPHKPEVALYASKGGTRLWRYVERKDVVTASPLKQPTKVSFSPCGKFVLASCAASVPTDPRLELPLDRVVIIDAKTGSQIQTIDEPLMRASWLQDGMGVMACDAPENAIRTYDAFNGSRLQTIKCSGDPRLFRIANKDVISVSSTGTMFVYDFKSGKETFKHHLSEELRGCEISPDGNRVAVGYWGQDKIEILDTRSGKQLGQCFIGRDRHVLRFSFSRDGKSLFVGNDVELIAFDVNSGEKTNRFIGHGGRVAAIAASPDGGQIVSGGESGRVIVWDVETGQRLIALADSNTPITSVDWSSDGKRVAAGKANGDVQIWTLSYETDSRYK
jgi:WD40 repeat protein